MCAGTIQSLPSGESLRSNVQGRVATAQRTAEGPHELLCGRPEIAQRFHPRERYFHFRFARKIRVEATRRLAMATSRQAVVIGVNKYEDDNIPELKGAENDAAEVRQRLADKESGGFKIEDRHF